MDAPDRLTEIRQKLNDEYHCTPEGTTIRGVRAALRADIQYLLQQVESLTAALTSERDIARGLGLRVNELQIARDTAGAELSITRQELAEARAALQVSQIPSFIDPHEAFEGEIELTAFALAHPDCDVRAVLRGFATWILTNREKLGAPEPQG